MTETTQIELKIYGRFSFCNITTPKESTRQDGSKYDNFCSHVLFSEKDAIEPAVAEQLTRAGIVFGSGAIQAVKDAQRKVAQAAWPKNWEAQMKALAHVDKLALHDGVAKAAKYPEYDGMYFVSANGTKRPTAMRTISGKNVPVVEKDGLFYGGAWGYLHVAIYPQGADGRKSDYGERINAQLMGAHWVKHGDQFGGGGRVAAPEEFAPISAGEADAPAPAAAGEARSLL
jgi:hypothetical protein